MRSYLAIIKDSFREAMASKTLWVLLFLLAAVLLVLAPFGYREEITVGMDAGSVRNPAVFVMRVMLEGTLEEPSPGRGIWNALEPSVQKQLKSLRLSEDDSNSQFFEALQAYRALINSVDAMLRQPDFCQTDDWKDVQLVSTEALSLKADWNQLDDDDKRRLNRLMLEAAFPDQVHTSPPTSVVFRYLAWDIGPPLPLRPQEFNILLEFVIGVVIEWLVGGAGILAAVLVTASIIPRTLEAGSINLLLSKPINRWALFLTKYLGGCAFILINAGFLVVGLWLVLGLRFGIWNSGLLLCIPIYVLVFAVYYSVSALAGVVWRSTVVAICVTILFYLTCSGVGLTKNQLESRYLDRIRIAQIWSFDGQLISLSERGLASRWNAAERNWEPVLDGRPCLLPPIYDPEEQRLIAACPSMRNRGVSLVIADRERNWESQIGAPLPSGAFAMLREKDGKLLVLSNLGIFRLTGDPLDQGERTSMFGIAASGSSSFEDVGPEGGTIFLEPTAAALNPETGDLAVYSRGVVARYSKDEGGRYAQQVDRVLSEDSAQPVNLAYGGDTLLVASLDGNLSALNGTTLKERKLLTPEKGSPAVSMQFTPGGRRAAIVSIDRRAMLFDAQEDTLLPARATGQGDISAANFITPDQLLAVDRANRATTYQVSSGKQQERFEPTMYLIDRIYWYGVRPLYALFPKPGELDRTVGYLLTGKEIETMDDRQRTDPSAIRRQIRPWTPVWSSLVFAMVVLVLGCAYVQRQEF